MVAGVLWPDNFADIVSVLMLRPDPFTRSWEPGETVEDLVADNIAHGVGLDHLPAGGGPLLQVANGRIVDGHPAFTGPIGAVRLAVTRPGMISLEG
jgi:hypothetical protein